MFDPLQPSGETRAARGPWGPWPTAGLCLLAVLAWVAAQAVVFVALTGGIGGRGRPASPEGWVVARSAILSAPVAVGAVLLLARARRGPGLADYLALGWPTRRQAWRWIGATALYFAVTEALGAALGRPLVIESMAQAYRTAGALPLFLGGLLVATPLAEEFLFRGFLFAGLVRSRLGPAGAIAVTALAWGVLHVQYDAFAIATIVGSGALLGAARWRTGSLWLCVVLHGLLNLLATAELVLALAPK